MAIKQMYTMYTRYKMEIKMLNVVEKKEVTHLPRQTS